MQNLFDAVSSVGWLVYILTFLLVFLETCGLPLPALSFALLAAALAGNGQLSFPAVVLATVLGGALGGPVGHAFGIRRGRPLLESMGARVRLSTSTLDSTQEQFEKRGKTILLARFFVPVLPWSAGIFSGIVRMPRGTVALYNFISITLWALVELSIAAFFSVALKDFLQGITLTGVLWLVTGIVGTFFLIRFFRRRKTQSAVATNAEAGVPSAHEADEAMQSPPPTVDLAGAATEPPGGPPREESQTPAQTPLAGPPSQ